MGSARATRRDRQVVRILGILKILTEGGRPTVHSLAARFRVRRETIYRDLHAIEAIGYPLAGDEAGHLSRPHFAPDLRPTMPPLLLSRQELAALVWAAVPKLQARYAHLYWLREVVGVEAWLVHLLFVDDHTHRPATRADWDAALPGIHAELGVRGRGTPWAAEVFLAALAAEELHRAPMPA